MNIEEITKFKTPDGKEFLTEEKAIDHIENCIGSEIEEILKPICENHRSLGNMMIKLVEDHKKLIQIQNILNRYLEND